ncbi:MAG: hypothetical protein GTO66_30755 [Candidatus Aminicenantes bacterium]|nr:hypothetical protein [Candidatus Aminicenantes bacterium]NIN46343.1 hypothetical protein [Candidatus Aminicenantes bacterium]
MASLTISTLSLIERNQKPLPEPDPDSINFIKEQFLLDGSFKKFASLVIAFYWKKPWTDEDLAEKFKNIRTGLMRCERNKSLILKALESGKERA